MMTEPQTKVAFEDHFDLHAAAAHWSATHREAADHLLDVYQKTVVRLADEHVKMARTVDLPAVTAMAETQATFSRDVADAYVSSVRKLLAH